MIGPKTSVDFLNSSGPNLLRRLHRYTFYCYQAGQLFVFCLVPPQLNPMIPS